MAVQNVSYSESEIAGLKRAYWKYSRQIGKYTRRDARVLMEHLALEPRAKVILDEMIDDWNAKDTFAGYARCDGISIRVQLFLLRECGVKVG